MVIANIQSLRALAALAVVFFHLPTFGGKPPFPDPLHGNLVELGASGVDIFFVISGFIMSLSFDQRPISTRDFIINRAVRIIPIYWCVTLLWWIWLVGTSEPYRASEDIVSHLAASLLFVAQPTGHELPLISPGWTLEYEMLFYAIFACFAALAHGRIVIVGALSLVAVASGGHFILLEFALGMWAYHTYKKGMSAQMGTLVFVLGVLVLFMTAWLGFNLSFEDSLTSRDRLLAWGLPAFLIVLGAATMPPITSKTLARLGDASYSIYITHAVVIMAFSGVIGDAFGTPLQAQIFCFALCVGVGILTYHWVERPLTVALKSKTRRAMMGAEPVRQRTA